MDFIMTIADNLQTLIDCKADMKSAIESKGVTVSGGLSTYADAIRQIDGNTINCELDFSKLNYTSSNISNTMINLQDSIDYGVWLASNKNNLIRVDPEYYHNNSGVPVKCDSFLQANPKLIFFPSAKISDLYVRNEYSSNYVGKPYRMFFGSDSLRTVGKIILDCEQESVNMFAREMFAYCKNLTEIELFDTSNVSDIECMFQFCISLKKMPKFDFSNVSSATAFIQGCTAELEGFPNLGKVENIGNGLNLMFYASNLSRQSCINVFNNLYDRANAGYTDIQLTFNTNVVNKLSSSDIAIATNKGYIIKGSD